MASKIVSPGVFTQENDLTFVPQGVAEIGAAIVGPFPKGPAFVPTTVETQADFRALFGAPDGNHLAAYAAEDYLRNNGRVTCVRVGGLGGYQQSNALALKFHTSGSTEVTVAVIASTSNGDNTVGFANAAFSLNSGSTYTTTKTGNLTLTGSTDYSISFDPRQTNYISTVLGESALGPKTAYSYMIFDELLSSHTGSSAEMSASLEVLSSTEMDFTSDISVASTPWVLSQLNAGTRYDLFRFHTLSAGNAVNRDYKIAIDQVKVAGSVQSSDYGSFNVTVRAFDDTDARPVVLETFRGVNLDPASANYIGRVIGDRNVTVDVNGDVSETGDYANNSRYVRVEVKDETLYPVTAIPAGFGAYTLPVAVSTLPTASFATSSMVSPYTKYSGTDFSSADTKNYFNPTPDSAGTGNNVTFSFEDTLGLSLTGSSQTATDLNQRKMIFGFQGGFDGMNPTVDKKTGSSITATNTLGLDCSTTLASGSVAYTRALNAISNADEFDINLLVTPGVVRSLHPSVTTKALDVCETRSDTFYLADFTAYSDTIDTAIAQANAVDSSYAATYYPWVKINDITTNKIIAVPPSVVMAGVYAANDKVAAEWWAPAGLNRGGIGTATSVAKRLDFSDRDNLYANKVNPIATFPGQGIVAYGQKTLQDKSSALDRINVRRLLIALKKFIASTSRFLVFEQNTIETRRRFISVVDPYLQDVQQRQGIYKYRIVMDDSNNTPDLIDRLILNGAIYIQPSRTAEFITLAFNILPTGASFD